MGGYKQYGKTWEKISTKGRMGGGKADTSNQKIVTGKQFGARYMGIVTMTVKKVLIRVKAQAGDFSLYQKSSTITFAALTELWLFTLQDLKDSTKAHYQYSFDHYILPGYGKNSTVTTIQAENRIVSDTNHFPT